ncbi:hypothetical protein [Teredinibacter franksiae]|uniref:hypothetical protein n=1 Tax=Teredinibacter franksiae TaxID=2761453 RepID=UPI00162534AC|nr:hypothetical protein [Teredinibacter franksiae]
MNLFEQGELRFHIKTSADISFRVGIIDTYRDQCFVSFLAGQSSIINRAIHLADIQPHLFWLIGVRYTLSPCLRALPLAGRERVTEPYTLLQYSRLSIAS